MTTMRPGYDDLVRVCPLACRRYGLGMKSAERLPVPWDAGELVAQGKVRLPERQAEALWNNGITELPRARLNAGLAPHGYVIQARKGPEPRRQVACMDQDGRVRRYGVFGCG